MQTLMLLLLLTAHPLTDADSAMQAGHYAQAAALYRQALALQPRPAIAADIQYKMARALAFSDSRAEAIEAYSVLIRRNPNNVDARLGRGRVYAWEKNWAAAEADLQVVTERAPRYTDAWLARGDVYLWSGRFAEAVTAYGEAIGLDGGDPAGYLGVAKAERNRGDFAAARAALRQAEERGLAAAALTREAEEIRRAEQAATHTPEAFMAQAHAALDSGDMAAAAQAAQLAAEVSPDPLLTPPPTTPDRAAAVRDAVQRADAARRAGNRAEALRLYDEAIAIEADNAAARYGRGLVRSWEKDFAGAEADLALVTQQQPANSDAWLALGNTRLWADEAGPALAAYNEVVRLRPQDAAGYLGQVRAKQKLGDSPGALADLALAETQGADAAEVALLRDALTKQELLWRARAGFEYTGLSSGFDEWLAYRASVGRSFDFGSVSIEGQRARRFGSWDNQGGIDAWVDLWDKSYVNLRALFAGGAEVLPRGDWMAELYQGLGGGWEISGFYRHMDFAEDNADIYGGSIARSVGDWYLRARGSTSRGSGAAGAGGSLAIRRYLKTTDDFIEVSGGGGREVIALGRGLHRTVRSTSAGLRLQYYFTDHWGVYANGALEDPDNYATRVTTGGGLLLRW